MKARMLAAAAASTFLAFTGTAFAHATLEAGEAFANATYKAVVRIPHGCAGQPTIAVEIMLPEGFVGAKPMPKAGWDLEIETGPFARTYSSHGREVSSGPRVIRWTGGSLADEHYDEFVVRGRLMDFAPGTVVAFPTTQTCPGGKIAWTEVAAPGQDPHDLARPAPTVTIVAASAGAGHRHGAEAAGSARVGDIVIEAAWTREPPPGAPVAGGYMRITNTGAEDDVLVGGSVAFAETFEVHEMSVIDGVMRMGPVEGGLAIPAGETVTLAPGGYHVMFMAITDAPAAGETVDVGLVFQRAGAVTVTMPVAPIGAGGPAGHGHH